MSYLRSLCLFVVSNTCCVAFLFVLFFFVLCDMCCQFLWIVHSFLIAPSVFSNVYLLCITVLFL
jgi:hypothetical protein